VAVVVVLLVAAALAGCSSDDGASDGTPPPKGQGSDTPVAEADGTYLSIGDSYAQGYQPTVGGKVPDYRQGFAYLLPAGAKAKGYDLSVVNLGCGGATVGSLADRDGCDADARAPGSPRYDTSQLAAALTFLEDHPGKVQLLTVSIGGNDVTACAQASDAIGCVTKAVTHIDAGLKAMLPKLRKAAGPKTVIVGLTYPDVILGGYLAEGGGGRSIAELSVTAFQQFINPMLKRNYEGVDGIFVDVTAATGAYTPLTETTSLAPYGTIPKAVAQVCDLTWFCQVQDIHPKPAGYRKIADLIVAALPNRS